MMDIPANAKYAIIRETSLRTDNLLSIKQLCSLAGVSRSGYYHYLSTEEDRQRRERQDQEDFRRIVEAYQFRSYAKGARGMYMRLIHSDQGAHYTSVKFVQLVKDSQLRQSMSRRANCWDNAPQKSFFGHMKDEIDLSGCICFEQIHEAIRTWADYYNNERYQWDLVRLAPTEYYRYLVTGEYPLSVPTPKTNR